jgi:hypothetical protein
VQNLRVQKEGIYAVELDVMKEEVVAETTEEVVVQGIAGVN